MMDEEKGPKPEGHKGYRVTLGLKVSRSLIFIDYHPMKTKRCFCSNESFLQRQKGKLGIKHYMPNSDISSIAWVLKLKNYSSHVFFSFFGGTGDLNPGLT
jgi:hypothetical protein